jgi:hypothetical protein
MGQPPAGVQPGVYAGLQRPERSIGQRLFPLPRKGWGQQDENADREDRIWRKLILRLDGSVVCSAVLPYLHFGQYSGKFLSSVSSRIFSRVLFLQAGHKIKWVVFTFLYTSCYLLNKLCIMFCNVFYFYRSVQCTPKKRLSISPQK